MAAKLALPFIDGDDLHSKENIDKMSRGEPLDDSDRCPWLHRIREEAIRASFGNPGACDQGSQDSRPRGLIVACSALKKSYRDVLRGRHSVQVPTVNGNALPNGLHPDEPFHPSLSTFFIHLTGSYDTLYKRMANRKGHYMKENLLDSQVSTLELPSDQEKLEDVIQVDFDLITDTEAQVESALSAIVRLAKEVQANRGLRGDSLRQAGSSVMTMHWTVSPPT